MALISCELAQQHHRETREHRKMQAIADKWLTQVDAFYSLPQQLREKDRLVFSPSLSSKCCRELFYMRVGVPLDQVQQIPWQARVPRNGTGVHDVTQTDILRMPKMLETVNFRVKVLNDKPAFEVFGDKTFEADGEEVRIAGSCDGILEYLEDGVPVMDILWEKKTRTRLSGLSDFAIKRSQESSHKYQAICYSLLFGINLVLFEYESLEKPPWGKGKKAQPDIRTLVVTVNEQMQEYLLNRLARVVRAVDTGYPPPRELDKCMFCRFKGVCAEDD